MATDPYYGDQWNLKAGPGGINIEKAWDTTSGNSATVVAILDSGIVTHEDLAPARILAGHDFVSDPIVANDGGGRDADPSDSGDWVTAAESSSNTSLRNCAVRDSSWHGSHITGIVGATANNAKGITGIDWTAKLLPVRVLGKCGNPTSAADDLALALYWAAGVDTGIAPVNQNPAKVINMSLSGSGSCPPNVQAAIDEATKRGAVVIAAAGNNSVSGSFWPATCKNVLTVAATDAVGKKASFSSWGSGVGVSAPGTAILSTVNPGTTAPLAGSAYKTMSGTSQAAAHVSGIAALMMAANPKLTPFETREMIKASAKPFAQGSTAILGDCGSGSCGTGIVNAAEAVKLSKMGKPAAATDPNYYEMNNSTQTTLITTLPNGQAVGWGEARFGQLGNASLAPVRQPATVPGLAQVDRVFAGGTTTWAILATGEAYALGQSSFSFEGDYIISLFGGDPTAPDSSTPVRTPLLDNATQIAVSYGPCSSRYDCPS